MHNKKKTCILPIRHERIAMKKCRLTSDRTRRFNVLYYAHLGVRNISSSLSMKCIFCSRNRKQRIRLICRYFSRAGILNRKESCILYKSKLYYISVSHDIRILMISMCDDLKRPITFSFMRIMIKNLFSIGIRLHYKPYYHDFRPRIFNLNMQVKHLRISTKLIKYVNAQVHPFLFHIFPIKCNFLFV